MAVERDLQDAGVETDRLLEHSDMAREVMVFAVAFTGAGGIRQLAHLLKVFFHRNDGKEIALKADGDSPLRGSQSMTSRRCSRLGSSSRTPWMRTGASSAPPDRRRAKPPTRRTVPQALLRIRAEPRRLTRLR
jgi:hypothetical protein